MEILMEHLGKGFVNMLLISMPVVLVAAGIGLVVGILQAVTQVQEQTIAAAPKILGVFITLIVMGGFFVKILTEYTIESTNLAFNGVTKQDEFVLPPDDGVRKFKFWDEEKNYSSLEKPTLKNIIRRPGKVPYSKKEAKVTHTKTNRLPTTFPNIVERREMSR